MIMDANWKSGSIALLSLIALALVGTGPAGSWQPGSELGQAQWSAANEQPCDLRDPLAPCAAAPELGYPAGDRGAFFLS
jgi:hypothetical protein